MTLEKTGHTQHTETAIAGVIYLIFFSMGGAAKNYDANISLRIQPFKTYYKSYHNVIERSLRKKVTRLLIYSTVFGPFM